jgi:fumarate hydratase subunit beta
MDAYSPRLLKEGLRGMIGKGKRSQDVIDTMKRHMPYILGLSAGLAQSWLIALLPVK